MNIEADLQKTIETLEYQYPPNLRSFKAISILLAIQIQRYNQEGRNQSHMRVGGGEGCGKVGAYKKTQPWEVVFKIFSTLK